jgi:hypothetical protein
MGGCVRGSPGGVAEQRQLKTGCLAAEPCPEKRKFRRPLLVDVPEGRGRPKPVVEATGSWEDAKPCFQAFAES